MRLRTSCGRASHPTRCCCTQALYVHTARSGQRLQSAAMSPVFSFYSETLQVREAV